SGRETGSGVPCAMGSCRTGRWDESWSSRMWPGRLWRPGASARPPCRRPQRFPTGWRRARMSRTEIEATPTGVPLQFFEELRRIRAFEPGRIQAAHAARQRRRLLIDGRLFVIAADHPARGALGVGGRQLAMGDRYDLLNRLVIA